MHVPELKKVAVILSLVIVAAIIFIDLYGRHRSPDGVISSLTQTARYDDGGAPQKRRGKHKAASGHRSSSKTQKRNQLTSNEDLGSVPLSPPRPLKTKKRGPTLPKNVIDQIEKFVFFVGYPRSGHSIIGSFMDAHPHVAIAHEFMLMKRWKYLSDDQKESGIVNPYFRNQIHLFNTLYRQCYWDAIGTRSEENAKKNYTLDVDYPWQGTYDKYISVIGDKSGGMTTNVFRNSSQRFPRYLSELIETVKVPIRVIHAVRNPYDLISTQLLYTQSKHLPLEFLENVTHTSVNKFIQRALPVSIYKSAMKELQVQGDEKAFARAKYNNEEKLKFNIDELIDKAKAVTMMINLIGPSSVLEVHNTDLVNDPKTTMNKICLFLEIDCTPNYLQACADKVFKSVSKTRNLLVWTPELQQMVDEELIHKYQFFTRYSFESE